MFNEPADWENLTLRNEWHGRPLACLPLPPAGVHLIFLVFLVDQS